MISDLFDKAVLEKIEEEFDLRAYEKAIEEYNNDPTAYTLEEVEKELEL